MTGPGELSKLLANTIRRSAARDVNRYDKIPPDEPHHIHLNPGAPAAPNLTPLTADSCLLKICQPEVGNQEIHP